MIRVRLVISTATVSGDCQSYLSTAAKWGLDTLDAMTQLFTTGAWLPPALTPDIASAHPT